jgi:hypothetical protein
MQGWISEQTLEIFADLACRSFPADDIGFAIKYFRLTLFFARIPVFRKKNNSTLL